MTCVALDVSGVRWGTWTVLGRAPGHKSGLGKAVMWSCRCDCGAISDYAGSVINARKPRRCIACRSKQPQTERHLNGVRGHKLWAENLAGQRFGHWLVVERVKHPDGAPRWLCICDCGHSSAIRSYTLKSKQSTRCKLCAEKCKDPSTKKFSKERPNAHAG